MRKARKKLNSTNSRRPFRLGRARTGLGLFATEPIKKGKYIIRYWGRLLNNEQADKVDNRYLFEINNRWTIDGATRKNIARYINHSCRPNSEVYFVGHTIKIRAIKNIKPGDEIAYDYGLDHFNAFIKPKGCQCDKCREKRAEERRRKRVAAKRKRARQKSRRTTARAST